MIDSQKERFTHIVPQVSSGPSLKAPPKVLCMGFILVLVNCIKFLPGISPYLFAFRGA